MFESIVSSIEGFEDTRILIGVLLLALVFSSKEIYDFWDVVSRRKLSMLKYLLEENGATGKAKSILQEQMNYVSISYVTGIKADKYLQERIIDLYEISNGNLSYTDLKKSLSFLEISDVGILKVRDFTYCDRLRFFFPISWSFLIPGILLFGTYVFSPFELPIRLTILLGSFLWIGVGFFIASERPSLNIAKKVKKEICKNREKLLSHKLNHPVKETPWWTKVAGSFENDPTFDEAVRLGEEWRRSAE